MGTKIRCLILGIVLLGCYLDSSQSAAISKVEDALEHQAIHRAEDDREMRDDDEEVSVDVILTTVKWGSENSWTLDTCSSSQTYGNNAEYTETCSLIPGDYTLTCTDSYGDGWHGGFIEIEGNTYCDGFEDGTEETAEVTIVGPLDCAWDDWVETTQCSACVSGDAGTQTFTRSKIVFAENGGVDCPGNFTMESECDTFDCCISWRQTGGCSADGDLEPANDKGCDESIADDASGYCECGNDLIAMAKGCEAGDYDTCDEACLAGFMYVRR